MRHNKIQDTLAKIMHDVWYDIEVEPTPQFLQGESFIHKNISTDGNVPLELKSNGLWRVQVRLEDL